MLKRHDLRSADISIITFVYFDLKPHTFPLTCHQLAT